MRYAAERSRGRQIISCRDQSYLLLRHFFPLFLCTNFGNLSPSSLPSLPLLSQIRSLHRALRHRLQEKLARNLERGEQVTTAVGVGLLVAASAFLVAKVVLGRGSKR